jgi:hypothetical protein
MPETALTLLRESFEDLHLLLLDLVKLSRLPYSTFNSVGKIVYREVRRSDLLAMLIDKKFKPVHDRIGNRAVSRLIREIPTRSSGGRRPRCSSSCSGCCTTSSTRTRCGLPEEELRDTILLFALVVSETRLLLSYIERRRDAGARRRAAALPDLRLVRVLHPARAQEGGEHRAQRHLGQPPGRSRADPVENSHGILKDCFQQSIVQLAQAFDPEIDGARIFPDFSARRDQSMELRDGLVDVVRTLNEFQQQKDAGSASV